MNKDKCVCGYNGKLIRLHIKACAMNDDYGELYTCPECGTVKFITNLETVNQRNKENSAHFIYTKE